MKEQDRYDSLIQWYAQRFGLDWRRIKAQLMAESSMNPLALSPAGAVGLAQALPDTWDWVWRELLMQDDPSNTNPHDPENAIVFCCAYMRHLVDCYGEIPDEIERYKFALAAYNAGRGNINRCLGFARKACGLPQSYRAWDNAGRRKGPWQIWEFASRSLSLVTGPHARETIGYVAKIMGDGRQ